MAYDSRVINTWYHTSLYDDFTPKQFTSMVCNDFFCDIQKFNLQLNLTLPLFFKSISYFTCLYFLSKKLNKSIGGPRIKQTNPFGWTKDCEKLWMNTLQYNILNSDYWSMFWKKYDIEHPFLQELSVQLTTILPYYIQKNIDVLISNKLIIKDKNDKFILWEDYESEPDEEEYDYSVH